MVCLIMLYSVPTSAATIQSEQETIREDEIVVVQNELRIRNLLGDDLRIELLRDTRGYIKYLLGVSELGYIIIERDSYIFHEAGEHNPFEMYANAEKYYGGPLCYFVKDSSTQNHLQSLSNQYYDIVRKTSTPIVYAADFNKDIIVNSQNTINPAVTSTPIEVSNAYSYIQRHAFGFNNDNTCSAVAAGIVLNYLTLQYGTPYVNPVTETLDNNLPENANDLQKLYPTAHALHRCIVDKYGMGPASHASDVSAPMIAYLEGEAPGYSFTVTWTYAPKAATIKSNIASNKPVLITTTFAGDYSWHTMACYGYREVSGAAELLVHTGWYGTAYNTSYTSSGATHYYQSRTWISEGYATIGYYCSFD